MPHALADESNLPSMGIEDAQVQQWLRADFTPYHQKVRSGDARQRMKAVGLGVMAGRNLMRMVKGAQTQIPALPFEVCMHLFVWSTDDIDLISGANYKSPCIAIRPCPCC